MSTAQFEFAEKLNGRKYGSELNRDEAQAAKDLNLVVVFGCSNDNMEFRGAIDDKVSCYDGGFAYLSCDGLLENNCPSEYCPHYKRAKAKAETIEAIWDNDGYAWTYKTTIPHKTFDILEDGGPYCKGIIFDLRDVTQLS